MSAITSFVTDIVHAYIYTASRRLMYAHWSQFDLTAEEIEALYWPPEERQAARTVTCRILAHGGPKGFDLAYTQRVHVRVNGARALVPQGFYSHDVSEPAPMLDIGSVRIANWSSILSGCPSDVCINEMSWVDTCEVSRTAADKLDAWASGVAADLICFGEALEALKQVFSAARSLQDARNWIPQLPMILNYSVGKYMYAGRLHTSGYPGSSSERINEETVAKVVDKIKDFKEAKNGWVPSPGQRARLKALQGWINKASFLMENTESANLDDVEALRKPPIRFSNAAVRRAAVSPNFACIESL